MVDLSDAVTAIFTNDTEAFAMGYILYGVADIAQCGARTHLTDTGHHGFIGCMHQTPGQRPRLAHKIHAAGVAVPAVLGNGHIYIDDIAIAQHLIGRNAMTDDM